MLMKDDKNKSLAMIISGKMKPHEDMQQPEQDSDIGLKSAAEEVLSAMESKDADSLKNALESFIQMCSDKHESSEPEGY